MSDALQVQDFRHGMRQFIGCPTIVTATASDGSFIGLTATSVCSLSLDPPSLVVCLHRKTALAALLERDGAFAVNLPSAEQADIARVFGGMTDVRGADKFRHGTWRTGETGAPVLDAARVSFECSVAEIHEGFSHLILIGLVRRTRLEADRRAGGLAYVDGTFLDWSRAAAHG